MGRTNTRRSRELSRATLRASTICHLCGHDGADAADHVIPVDVDPSRQYDPTNLAPAHHYQPCAECGIKCNRVKSNKTVAPILRRSGALRRPTPRGETPPPRPSGSFSS